MKLFTKLFLSIFVSIMISFVVYTIIIMTIEKETIENTLHSKIKYNEGLYASSVSHLLYQVNTEIMNSLLNAIYVDKEIVKINLIDFSNTMNITLQNKQTSSKNLIKSTIKLAYNAIPLGELELYYTKEHVEKHLNLFENSIVTFFILLTLILLGILLFFINKFTSSLTKLARATDTIALGNLSKEICIDSDDEIGMLANKFEKMRKKLLGRRLVSQRQSEKIAVLNEEMFSTQKIVIETLGQVVEKRYIDDPNHIKRVAQMSYMLAKLLGLGEEDAKILRIVSPMHDVGKIGISDAILLKPAKLTAQEFEIMKEHSTIGFNILKDTNKKILDSAALVAYEHHEKWDGTGYPRGLKAGEISIFGQITGLIDVYDALANKRCYKDAWSDEKIISYIQENSGTQFNPKLANAFLENFKIFKEVQDLH